LRSVLGARAGRFSAAGAFERRSLFGGCLTLRQRFLSKHIYLALRTAPLGVWVALVLLILMRVMVSAGPNEWVLEDEEMVRERVKRLLLCWLAVSACFLFTACGNKKKAPRPATPITTPDPRQERDPRFQRDVPNRDPRSPERRDSAWDERQRFQRRRNELDRNSGRSSQERDGDRADDRDRDDDSDDDSESSRDERIRRERGSRQYRVGDQSQVVYDQPKYRPVPSESGAAHSVFDEEPRADRGSVQKGPVNHHLLYSGAAEDNVVDLLRDQLAGVPDDGQRQRNQEFANVLGHTTVHFKDGTNEFEVTALINLVHYKFHGRINADFRGSFSSSELPGVKGNIACLNLNGGCHHMSLFFKDESEEAGPRYAYVVVRDTPAKLFFKARNPGYSNNPEYIRLLKIFEAAKRESGRPLDPDKPERLTFLNLLTSETVNGQASFAVKMQFFTPCRGYQEDNGIQTTTLAGPLKMAADGSEIDIHVSTAPSVTYLAGTLTPVDPYEGRMSDAIKMTRLVGNNGKGEIKLRLRIRTVGHRMEEEDIYLTITRLHSEVRSDIIAFKP
jgi:hypothetical protein